MSDKSAIEWTDATWNPVTGCTKVSPGCDHCYAETFAERFRGVAGHHFEGGFDLTLRPERLDQPLRWKRPRRVFVNSMSDLFHVDVSDEFIARVFAVMAEAGQHTFQLLTKRHGRMRSLLTDPDWRFQGMVGAARYDLGNHDEPPSDDPSWGWPLPNVWLGVSVEDQQRADLRIPALLDTPAAVRWISAEPLLGPVDLSAWMPEGFCRWRCSHCHRFYTGAHREACPGCGRNGHWCGSHVGNLRPNGQPLGWIVAGGESGRGARPMHPDWARSLRDQCSAAGVPFLFKQWGEYQLGSAPDDNRDIVVLGNGHHYLAKTFWDDGHAARERASDAVFMARVGKKAAGRELDGRTWDGYPQDRAAVPA